jgi:hypothetical protein
MLPNYRITKSQTEILDTLYVIQADKCSILVWQNHQGRRPSCKASITFVDLEQKAIIITPNTPEDAAIFQQFDSKLTFYIKGEVFSILFKQERPSVIEEANVIRIPIPSEVQLIEKRAEARANYDELILKIKAGVYLGGLGQDNTKFVNAELYDVSISGMSICIDKKYAHQIYVKDTVRILKLGEFRFPENFLGTIVYMSPKRDNSSLLKLGVRFHQKITQDTLIKLAEALKAQADY